MPSLVLLQSLWKWIQIPVTEHKHLVLYFMYTYSFLFLVYFSSNKQKIGKLQTKIAAKENKTKLLLWTSVAFFCQRFWGKIGHFVRVQWTVTLQTQVQRPAYFLKLCNISCVLLSSRHTCRVHIRREVLTDKSKSRSKKLRGREPGVKMCVKPDI